MILLEEADYRYGIGSLKLRVVEVATLHARAEWVGVRGVEIRWNGSEGAAREVLVRVAALPR